MKDIENVWADVDTLNSNELSKITMYQLLKRLRITPEITHDEINTLWKVFILKDNKKLDFFEFIRHIGYSKKSAAFQNAKLMPPTRGDGDVLQLSKNLSTEKVLVRETVLHKARTLICLLKSA